VASPLVLFVHFSCFLLSWDHLSVYSWVWTMGAFLFCGPFIEAFVAWLRSAGPYSLVSFPLFFCVLLGFAFLFYPLHAMSGVFSPLSWGPGLIEH